MDADTDGAANTKDIQVDFNNVVFSGAGVYRYKITETLGGTEMTYAKIGVTEGSGGHERFLDVYVKPSEGYPDGTNASDWDIYGYVCVANGSAAVTPETRFCGVWQCAMTHGGKIGANTVFPARGGQ